MRSIIGSLAIVQNFVGVVLMVRYGLPNNLPLLGKADVEVREADLVERDRRSLLGVLGLVPFALGSAIFIITNAWTAD